LKPVKVARADEVLPDEAKQTKLCNESRQSATKAVRLARGAKETRENGQVVVIADMRARDEQSRDKMHEKLREALALCCYSFPLCLASVIFPVFA